MFIAYTTFGGGIFYPFGLMENLKMATTKHVASASELRAALASAKGGDTILLKSGDYGWVSLDNLKFDSPVTIRSADDAGGARFRHITLKDSTHLILDAITVEYGRVTVNNETAIDIRNSHHVKIVNSEIIGHTGTKDWLDVGRGIMVWQNSSNVEIADNHIHHFARGALFFGNNMVVRNNLIDDMRFDGLFFGKSDNLLIENNFLTDFYRQGTGRADYDHADYIQFDPGTTGAAHNVVIRGNVMLKGNGKGDVQGIFGANHHMNAHNSVFENFLIEDNIYLDHGLNAIQFYSGKNMVVRNNTVLTDPADGRVVWVRLYGPQSNSVIEDNVATQVNAEGGASAFGNVTVQYKDPAKPNYYGDLFANPFAEIATLADLAPKAGSPIGYGSGKGAEARFKELFDGASNPVNTAPVAEDDSVVTTAGEAVAIKVLANDRDPDGDALAVTSVAKAAHGAAQKNADGTVTYTPAVGFTGKDGFTYAISDGKGGTDSAHVAVSVAAAEPAIPAPVFASDEHGFDGARSAALILPHQKPYEVASGTLTLAFTADAISGLRGLFSKDAHGYGGGGHLTIHIDNGDLVARLQSAKQSFTLTIDDAITAGAQHHAAVTFGPGGLKLYLDGKLMGSSAYTGGLVGNKEPLVIGAIQTMSGKEVADVVSDVFDGAIASVALYDRPLDDALVLADSFLL